MNSERRRFEEFGLPLLGLAASERFQIHQVNWEGTDIDPTDTAEISYVDTLRPDLPMRTSIRTYHDGSPVRGEISPDTSMHQHLVTAFSVSLVPSGGIGPGFRDRLGQFSRDVSDLRLRDAQFAINGEQFNCRTGVFRYMSVAEVIIDNRIATLVGPDGFLEEPLTTKSGLQT